MTCQDGLTLDEGECVCPVDGHQLNVEGECEECQVEGCVACEKGNPQKCARCKDCSASIIDGECTCSFDDAAWKEGMCVSEHEANTTVEAPKQQMTSKQQLRSNPCEAEGCVECQDGQCTKCKSGMFMDGGECEQCDWKCQECTSEEKCQKCRSGFTLNEEDQRCYQCRVQNCGKCDIELGRCEECKDDYEMREGKCELVRGKVSASEDMSFDEFKRKYGKQYKD